MSALGWLGSSLRAPSAAVFVGWAVPTSSFIPRAQQAVCVNSHDQAPSAGINQPRSSARSSVRRRSFNVAIEGADSTTETTSAPNYAPRVGADWGVASCPVRLPVCLYTNSAAWPKKGTDPLPDVQTSFISRDWAGACPLFWAKPQFRPATIPPISAPDVLLKTHLVIQSPPIPTHPSARRQSRIYFLLISNCQVKYKT